MIKQQGFTLLEAIVALLLITTTGMALLSWINTNLLTLGRIQQAYQRHEAIRNGLAFMESVNPYEKEQGEATLGIYQMTWKSHVIERPKMGLTPEGTASTFEVGLYDTEVHMKVSNVLVAQFTLRQVGFKQLYKPSQDDDL